MFEKLEIMNMARQMAVHASARQSVVAQNVANADTPNYRAKQVADFARSYDASDVANDMRATRAAHLGAVSSAVPIQITEDTRSEVSPNGNSVSLEDQMVLGAQANSQHNRALAIYKSSLDIMRLSLGRGR